MSDTDLSARVGYSEDMQSSDGGELVAVDVELPRELLVDIDRLAVFHGYATQSEVVREALDRQ